MFNRNVGSTSLLNVSHQIHNNLPHQQTGSSSALSQKIPADTAIPTGSSRHRGRGTFRRLLATPDREEGGSRSRLRSLASNLFRRNRSESVTPSRSQTASTERAGARSPLSMQFSDLSGRFSSVSMKLRNRERDARYARRRAEIRAERTNAALASTATAETSGNGAIRSQVSTSIRNALLNTRDREDAVFLMVGYSPTGGGHTGRTLDIIDIALNDNNLKEGDTAIFHVPSIWNDKPRPSQLDSLAQKMQARGITVVMAEADKSVHGYLKPDGSSDDPKILERFALLPKRARADVTSILDAKPYAKNGDFAEMPSISANHLMDSLEEIIGGDAMRTKVKVLTDMDPSLQKAAKIYEVPGDNRVDQQNHAILLALDPNLRRIQNDNFRPELGLLAKVISGNKEHVSHIGLGDRNTLLGVVNAARTLGIVPDDTKLSARNKVVDFLLANGNPVNIKGPGQVQGIMTHGDVQTAKDIDNVVYVYAHGNQNAVAQKVNSELDRSEDQARLTAEKIHHQITRGAETAQEYRRTMFVFCGPNTLRTNADGSSKGNAMHLAYLADGDGVTTSGAGTHGEFSYLHKSCGSQSRLLALPIAGHNEQEANASYLAEDDATGEYVTVRAEGEHLDAAVNTFVKVSYDAAEGKYANGTMQQFLASVSENNSYARQGKQILFDNMISPESEHIRTTEISMRDRPELTAARKYMKLAFQAMVEIESVLNRSPGEEENLRDPGNIRIQIQMSQKSAPQTLTLSQLSRQLNSKRDLTNLLGADSKARDLAGLKNMTRNLITNIAAGSLSKADIKREIHLIRERFGHELTTGF